jgi:hypothetical protein
MNAINSGCAVLAAFHRARNLNQPDDMQLNFDKAHKLITELEAKLHATSTHTSSAREVLGKWIQSGEAQMRKKSAAALKQVRKKADGFTKALTKLEENFARSLDKLTKSLEKPAKSKKSQPPRAKAKKGGTKFAMDVTKAPPRPVGGEGRVPHQAGEPRSGGAGHPRAGQCLQPRPPQSGQA